VPNTTENRSRAAKLGWQNTENTINRALWPRSNGTSFITHNRYDPETGCWNWTGGLNSYGYGQKQYMGRREYVHRLSAHFYLGYDLNSDLCVLHRCDNPACFNPKHLFIGTMKENSIDMVQKGRNPSIWKPKTHCKHGHDLSGDNVYIRPHDSHRQCKICMAKRSKESQARKRLCRDIRASV
jgi:HNH endonuclease